LSKIPDFSLRCAAETRLAPKADVPDRPALELLHELQIHQIELEMQIEALQQSQMLLEESRDLYLDFYEFAPIGYLTLDRAGVISELNFVAATLLGNERNKLKQICFMKYVADADKDRWHQHFLYTLQHAKKLDCELALLRCDGVTLHVRLDGQWVQKAKPSMRIALSDITERKLLEQALVSVAEQRQRSIGQDLHDNLGQQIAAIGYQASALEKRLCAANGLGEPQLNPMDTVKIASAIATQAQHAVLQCKQLAQGLLPFELETHGLMFALQALASRIISTYRVACEFICPKEVHIDDSNLALNLYRIAQEATYNAIRHGRAQRLSLVLDRDAGRLSLSICDDGCGFVESGTASGMGVKIMRYRARQIGAALQFLKRPEGGTELRIELC
jgi:PAS domain S-box-containing protein